MDLGAFVRLGILLLRPGMLFGAAPVFGGVAVSPVVKVGLAVGLAVLLLPIVPIRGDIEADTLLLVVTRELAIGLAIAMAVRLLMAGAELAGQLAGFQLGLSLSAVVDPQSGIRSNVLASAYGMMALLTFLAIDGHHAMVRALVQSYEALPIGAGAVDATLVEAASAMLGLVFRIGAQLSAPIVIVLVIVEIAMGLITRAAPAFNLLVIGFPIRLLVGLAALGIALQVVPGLIARVAGPALELSLRAAGSLK